MSRRLAIILVVVAIVAGTAAGYAINRVTGDDKPAATPTATTPTGRPSPPTPSPSPTVVPIADTDLLTAADFLPIPPYTPSQPEQGGGPMGAYEPGRAPTLVCQPEWLSSLDPAGSASVDFHNNPRSVSGYGEAHEAILSFGSTHGTLTAFNTVRGWLDACPATLVGSSYRVRAESPLASFAVKDGEGVYAAVSYCWTGDCQTPMVARLYVAQLGLSNRVVLLSYAESGTPTDGDFVPVADNFNDRASAAVTAALARARQG